MIQVKDSIPWVRLFGDLAIREQHLSWDQIRVQWHMCELLGEIIDSFWAIYYILVEAFGQCIYRWRLLGDVYIGGDRGDSLWKASSSSILYPPVQERLLKGTEPECVEYILIFKYIGHEHLFVHSFVSIFLLQIYIPPPPLILQFRRDLGKGQNFCNSSLSLKLEYVGPFHGKHDNIFRWY